MINVSIIYILKPVINFAGFFLFLYICDMNTKKTYQGQVTVTFNFSVNFEKLYLVVYYNILLERGRVDQTIHDRVFNEYIENDVYYLNDVFDEDIMRYHNHEAIRDLIKEDFKEWILINKKNG